MPGTVTKQARRQAAELLAEHGQTYAAQAGIRLRDKPAPLYQLMVLVTLLSKPIGADLAVAGTRELLQAGYRTPQRMLAASWQQRVDALSRAHYRRFDESTATRLEQSATWLLASYRGDLRRLAAAGGQQPAAVHQRLQDIPGIGATGASIFLREAQAVWPWLRPFTDDRVTGAARQLGLPHTPRALAELAGSQDLSALAAALIRGAS
jgi:endonuclease III